MLKRPLAKLPVPILALVVALAACSANTRATTIAYTVQGLTAAGATLQAYGPPHELDLVHASKSPAEAESKIAYWKETRAKLWLSLEAAFRALAVAKSDDAVTAAIQQAAAFYASLTAAGVFGGGQ
jgi:hypothetical protein